MLKKKIRLVSITPKFFDLCSFDKELLQKGKARPHLYILRLKYHGGIFEFALPLRSNISKTIKEENFFSLPPNKKTRKNCHHGIHFEKMFPIKKEYKMKFETSKTLFFTTILEPFLEKNLKKIIIKAQEYLKNYEQGVKTSHSTNIDKIFIKLNIKLDKK